MGRPLLPTLALVIAGGIEAASAPSESSSAHYAVKADVLLKGFKYASAWNVDHQTVFRLAAADYLNTTADTISVELHAEEAAHRRLAASSSSSSSSAGFHFDWMVETSEAAAHSVYDKITALRGSTSGSGDHRFLGGNASSDALQNFVDDWKATYDSVPLGVSAPAGMTMEVVEVRLPEEVHHDDHGDHHGCHHSTKTIFELGDDLDPKATLQAVLFLVLLTIIFEIITSTVEQAVEHHAHLEKMYSKITIELTILGLISFVLQICIQAGAIAHGSRLLAFEFAHIAIFFVAVMYIIQAWILLLFKTRLSRKFHFFDVQTKQAVVTMLNESRQRAIPAWLTGSNGREALRYRKIRAFFISKHKDLFPAGMSTEQFSFSLYLEQMLNHQVEAMLDIETSTWLVVSAAAGGFYMYFTMFEWSDHVSDDYRSQTTLNATLWVGFLMMAVTGALWLQSTIAMKSFADRVGVGTGVKYTADGEVDGASLWWWDTDGDQVRNEIIRRASTSGSGLLLENRTNQGLKRSPKVSPEVSPRGGPNAGEKTLRIEVADTEGEETGADGPTGMKLGPMGVTPKNRSHRRSSVRDALPHRSRQPSEQETIEKMVELNKKLKAEKLAKLEKTRLGTVKEQGGAQSPGGSRKVSWGAAGQIDSSLIARVANIKQKTRRGLQRLSYRKRSRKPVDSIKTRVRESIHELEDAVLDAVHEVKSVGLVLADVIRHPFAFHPTWYRTGIAITMMFDNFYLAWFFAHTLMQAIEESNHTYLVIGALPALVMMLLLIPWTMENYSIMLSAMAMVGHDDKQKMMFNSVISFMQEETALVRRVQARFRVVGVKDLFDVLDEDDSGSISYTEFKRGLARQKIYLSSAELTKVYRVADPDSSGSITLPELEAFMNHNQRTRAAVRSRVSRIMMKIKMAKSLTRTTSRRARGPSQLKINPVLSSVDAGGKRKKRRGSWGGSAVPEDVTETKRKLSAIQRSKTANAGGMTNSLSKGAGAPTPAPAPAPGEQQPAGGSS